MFFLELLWFVRVDDEQKAPDQIYWRKHQSEWKKEKTEVSKMWRELQQHEKQTLYEQHVFRTVKENVFCSHVPAASFLKFPAVDVEA